MADTPRLPSDPSQDRGPTIVGFLTGFTAAGAVSVVLRLAVRYHHRLLGWDDLMISFALVACILLAVFGSMAVANGYGKHLGDIPTDERASAFFWFYLAQICYKCVTWPTKISILMFYRRVFGDTPGIRAYGIKFYHLLSGMLAIVVGAFLATSVVGIFSCRPVRFAWDKGIEGSCVSAVPWWFSYAALNISTDVVILLMPLPLINGLMQVTKRQKIVLSAVFLLGAFVCVVTVIRMTTLKTGAKGNDPSYSGATTLEWTAVETGVGIICACLPLLRSLLTKLIPWFAQRARTLRTRDGHDRHIVKEDPRDKRKSAANIRQSWGNWSGGRTAYISNVTARQPASCNSSEVGIALADGITRKVEYGTLVENVDEIDADGERQSKPMVSSDSVV